MKRMALATFTVVFVLVGISAVPQAEIENVSAEQKRNHVVWERTAVPRHQVYRKKFSPYAEPNYNQIQRIISIESSKWGASRSHLDSRIACESTYKWYAQNGPYLGLGQFHPGTFSRGMSTIRTRRVKMKITKIKYKPVVTYRRWSRGELTKKYGKMKRVRRVTIYRGRIPKYPSVFHGWAQVRIMAQAIVGQSAVNDSEWACR